MVSFILSGAFHDQNLGELRDQNLSPLSLIAVLLEENYLVKFFVNYLNRKYCEPAGDGDDLYLSAPPPLFGTPLSSTLAS